MYLLPPRINGRGTSTLATPCLEISLYSISLVLHLLQVVIRILCSFLR